MSALKRALQNANWHCEPPEWSLDDDGLTVVTGEKTDFWQDTFYGFRRDDGHFFGLPAEGDFTATVIFECAYEVLYDQAGLMMRVDRNNWVKTGIEYSDDVTNFSVVVTRDGRSDWSVVGMPSVTGPQEVRLTRVDTAVIAHFRGRDGGWHLMRVADFRKAESVQVGPMACSPERAGFSATFLAFSIGPAIEKPLHAD